MSRIIAKSNYRSSGRSQQKQITNLMIRFVILAALLMLFGGAPGVGNIVNVQAHEEPTEEPTTPPSPTPLPTDVPTATPVPSAPPTEKPNIGVFDPALSKIGYLPAGSLGLPGEPLIWEVTVTNDGGAAGNNIEVVDTIRSEMRIDAVNVPAGLTSVVNGQQVTVTIATLNPGQSVVFTINTTVLQSPINSSILDNTASIAGTAVQDTAAVTVRTRYSIISPLAAPSPLGPDPRINGVPELSDFAGIPFCFTPLFTNVGNDGYGPYIILVRDAGLTLNSVTYLGVNLMAAPFLIASGTLPANDPIDTPRPIPGAAGHVWTAMRLPIGSVQSVSPAIPIDICMQSNPLSTIGVPLPINIYPGYEFGNTPTGANGPISNHNDTGPMDNSGSFTPILVRFNKSNTLPESEVPPSCYPAPPVGAAGQPGPACAAPPGVQWPYEYILNIELAPGQTINGNLFTDVLDPAFEFYPYTFPVVSPIPHAVQTTGTTCTTAGPTINFNGVPVTALPALQPPGGGTLTVGFTSVTNPSAAATCVVNVRYRGFINDVLAEAPGTSVYSAINNASFGYSWTGNPQPTLNATNTVDVRNLVIQKGANPTTVTPGNVVSYTLTFQISEYIGIQTMTVTDTIPDGIDFNVGSAVVTVPGIGTAPITGANATITYGADTGALVFNVTGALPGPYAVAGSGTITYTGTVRQIYRAGGSLTGFVSANDSMTNTLVTNFVTTAGQNFNDDTSASVRVTPNNLVKQLVSAPVDATTGFVGGEPVTFRLVLRIPSGDTRNLVIEDNFPLPVFDVQDGDFGIEASTFSLPDPTGRSAPFDVNNTNGYCASYPNISFPLYTRACGIRFVYDNVGNNGTNLPLGTSVTATRVANTLRLTINAPVETTITEERRVVVELTAGIIDRPFADNLFLTNRSQATYENTPGQVTTLRADEFVDVAAPDVQICKGISATTNASSVAAAGPACNVPGAANNDLTNVDAGDQLTYTITARNIGGANAYGVQISDNITTLPQVTACTLLDVRDGSGNLLAFTGTFPNLTLTSPLPPERSSSVTTAQATAVIRYTCTVIPGLLAGGPAAINTASVVFASFSDALPGGTHLPPGVVSFSTRNDTARFTPATPTIAKTRTPATATISELITYTLTVNVPGGVLNNVTIEDTLDAGLAFVDCTGIGVTGGITSSLGLITSVNFCNDGTTIANNPVISGAGGVARWNFGNLTALPTLGNDAGTITITYTAVVLNQAGVARGSNLNNSAVLGWDNPVVGQPSLTTSASAPNTTIIEPTLILDKTVSPTTTVDAGDILTYTLDIRHIASNATAYDVVITDSIPAGSTYVTGSLANVAGFTAATSLNDVGSITATWSSLTTAQIGRVQFQVRVNDNVQPAQVINNNTALARWTSTAGTPPVSYATYNPLGVERTGNTADVGGAQNTYSSTDAVSNTVASPTTAKVISSSTDATTIMNGAGGAGINPDQHAGGANTNLSIGERVTFQITYTFPEGQINNVTLADTISSAGVVLNVVSSRIVSIGGSLTTANGLVVNQAGNTSGAFVQCGGANQSAQVFWSAGTVTNTPDGVSNTSDQIVVEVVMVVADNAANVGIIGATPDVSVNNRGRLNFCNSANTNINVDNNRTFDIVEPQLSIAKTTVTAMPIDANSAASSVTFRLTISHTANSTAIAYNLLVSDTLPATMSYVALGAGTTCVSVSDTGSAGTAVVFNFPSLADGTSCLIDFTARLLDTARPNSTYVNSANVRYDSNSTFTAGETRRTTSTNTTSNVTTTVPTIVKTTVVADTNLPETGSSQFVAGNVDLNNGEVVTFTITTTLPEGTNNNFIVSDTLPADLVYQSSTISAIGSSLSGSSLNIGDSCAHALGDVTCTFGNLLNTPDDVSNANDQIVIRITARANNTVNGGTTLTNRVNARVDTATGTYTTPDATVSVDIVEPTLVINKTVNPITGDAGDTVTYTITVTNTGTGPAYVTRVTDPLLADLALVVGSVTTTAGTITTGNTAGDTTIQIDIPLINPGAVVTITFQATLRPSVFPGQVLTNTATQIHNSLPTNDGRSKTTNDTATVTVTAPQLVKSITATSETATSPGAGSTPNQYTAAPDLAIGETVTYQMPVTVPEGTVNTLRLVDTLPSTGGGDPGTLIYVSSRVVSIGGNTTAGATGNGSNLSGSSIAVGTAGTVAGQTITFNFTSGGPLTNTANGVSDANDIIIVEVVARVGLLLVNANGDLLINRVILTYDGGLTINGSANADVVEPQLSINKSASPTSNLNAGDIVTYTITVAHTAASRAEAFDVAIADTIPAALTYVGNVTASSGPAPTVTGTAPNLTFSWDNIPLGSTYTFTFEARVNNTVIHNQTITNTANLGWTSLVAGDITTNDPNERTYTGSSNVPVTTNLTPLSFAKTVIASSEPTTGTARFDAPLTDLTIGETVTYELRARLQEGTTNVTLIDTLPAGFTFVSATIPVGNGANLTIPSVTTLPHTLTPTVAGQVVTMTLGNIVNAFDNVADAADELVVQVVARVADVVGNEGVTGADKVNTARLTWNGGNIDRTVSVEVVEPQLAMSKAIVAASPVDAGDNVRYTLTISHTANSTSDAFNVTVPDTLPNIAGTPVVNYTTFNAALSTCDNSGILTSNLVGALVTFSLDHLPLATGSCTIVYDVTVNDSARISSTYSNSANISSYTTLPTGGRTEPATPPVSQSFTTAAPTIAKTVFTTSVTETGNGADAEPDLAIGETATYRLTVTLPEGTTNALRVEDALPATGVVLEVVSSQIFSVGANISGPTVGAAGTLSAGPVVTWNLGNVTNAADGLNNAADTIVFEVVARAIASNPANVGLLPTPDSNLINTATLRHQNGAGVEQTPLTSTANVDFVEPQLDITKTAAPTSNLNAGDTVTFTMRVLHTANSTADAFDVAIADSIPAGLTYAGNVTAITGLAPTVTGTAPNITFSWDSIPLGGDYSFTFEVTVSNTVVHNQTITNTGDLRWTSLPTGDITSNDPAERAYTDTSSVPVTTNVAPLSFAKTVAATSETFTTAVQFSAAPDLAIGETVTFELRARLREGTTPVTLTDTLPAGLVYVSASIPTTNGANISVTGVTTLPHTLTPTVAGQVVTVNLGNVVNVGDNLTNTDDDLVVWVVARATGTNGSTLTNQAVFDWGGGTLSSLTTVDIVEPTLDITKTANPTSGVNAGDTITYTLNITHTVASTVDAFDVTIPDSIPAGLTYTAATSLDLATSTCDDVATLTQDTSGLPGSVTYILDALELTDVSCTIVYTVTVNNSSTHIQSYNNTANMNWSSLPADADPNERNYNDSANATVSSDLTPLSFAKTVFTTSKAYTTAGQHDVPLTDLTIGETVTFELRARLQEGTTPITLTDTLPTGLVFISASIPVGNGANISVPGVTTLPHTLTPAVAGQVVTMNLGNVVNAGDNVANAADDLVVHVVARAQNIPANVGTTGTDLVNNARLNWGGGVIDRSASVEIVEPALDITKSASPVSGLDAGDTITYTISVTHLPASTADAQDVTISDVIPADMTYAGNITAVTGPAPAVSGTAPNLTFSWATIPLGSTYTFTFEVTLNNTVTPNQTIPNTADLDWDTIDGADPNQRSYTDTSSVNVITTTPTIAKAIITTSLVETGTAQHTALTDVNVGETVTYQMTVTLREGTTTLVVTDNLPDVMTVVSSRVVSIGANITGSSLAVGASGTHSDSNFVDGLSDRVTFNFGTVVDSFTNAANVGDQIVVEVVARVNENAANVNSDVLTNTVTLNYTTGATSDTESVEVTEPVLLIQKSAPVVTGRPNDIIDYTVVVTHAAASTGPAYDLVIADPIVPPGLNLIAGTVTSNLGTVTTGNGAADTSVRVDVPVLNLGQTLTITYQGRVDPNLVPPAVLTNVATNAYDSAGGPGGRTASINNDHTIRVNDDVYLYSKSVVDTSLDALTSNAFTTAPDVTIGETATFEIVAYLPEGTTNGFIITDNLPDGMSVVSSQVVSIGGVTTTGATNGGNLSGGALAVGVSGTHSDSNLVDGRDDRVVFNFGTVANVIDGVDNVLDQVVVRVVARLYDDTAATLNQNGQTKTNTALIDYGPNRRTATADIDVVEPVIRIEKTFIPQIEGRGHALRMRLVLTNTGGTTAYNVMLTDPLNILLRLDAVLVDTASAPGTIASNTSGSGYGGTINVTLDQLAPNGVVTVTVDLFIDPSTRPLPTSIPNTAEATYQSLPVGHPDEAEARQYTTQGSDTLIVDMPTILITKVIDLASVLPGGKLTYTITVTNTGDPDIDATNVIVTDTLPPGVTVISATPSQGSCGAVSNAVLTCNLNVLASTAPQPNSATIIVEAQVEASVRPGTRLVNRAGVVTAEGNTGEAEAVSIVAEPPTCGVGCYPWQVFHTNRDGNWEIYRLGEYAGNKDAAPNLTQNTADDVAPSRSPNGDWIAFASNRDGNWEIYVTPLDGDVTRTQRVTHNTIASDTDPVWGPTNYVVYETTRDGNWELYMINMETAEETRLTDNAADDINAFWSPDGAKVVFQSNRSGQWQLYELDLTTAQLRLLSDGSANDVDASYAPDGQRVAFRSYVGDGKPVITIMNADGSGRQAISDVDGNAANASWSPDASLIAYQSDVDGDLDIYVYTLGGGQTRLLTDNTIDDYAPTWLCDTTQILFTSDIMGNPDIFMTEALPIDAPAIQVDAEAQQMTDSPMADIYPEGAPVEENASKEGRTPSVSAGIGGDTTFIKPDLSVTPPDVSLAREQAWQPIAGCAVDDPLRDIIYRLEDLPTR